MNSLWGRYLLIYTLSFISPVSVASNLEYWIHQHLFDWQDEWSWLREDNSLYLRHHQISFISEVIRSPKGNKQTATVFNDTININEASAKQIAQHLKGIGLVKAQAIVDYRRQNGGFKHIDQLLGVKGIGVKTLEVNRKKIRLSD